MSKLIWTGSFWILRVIYLFRYISITWYKVHKIYMYNCKLVSAFLVQTSFGKWVSNVCAHPWPISSKPKWMNVQVRNVYFPSFLRQENKKVRQEWIIHFYPNICCSHINKICNIYFSPNQCFSQNLSFGKSSSKMCKIDYKTF